MRISNNARYENNFVPINEPFVNDINTLLLWHFNDNSNNIIDATTNNHNALLVGTYEYIPSFFRSPTQLPFNTPTINPTPTSIPTLTVAPTIVDVKPPSVFITSPAMPPPPMTYVNVLHNTMLTVQVKAVDNTNGSGVARVDFYANNILVGTDTTSPYSYTSLIPNNIRGTYQVQAKATDRAGNIGVSSILPIFVR